MNRGSIEISTFEPPLAPGVPIASERTGAREPPRPAMGTVADPPSPQRPSGSAARASSSVCTRSLAVPEHPGDDGNRARGTVRNFNIAYVHRRHDRSSRRRLASGVAAACISIALHALLITSILWSAGSPAKRPRDAGALNKAVPEASDDGALQVTFIQELSSSATAVKPLDINALASANAVTSIPIPDSLVEQSLSVPDFSTDADPTSPIATPAADAGLRSAMYGRYVGQLDARIERAWRRPRTSIGAPAFSCLVRIDQDSRGTVLEVTLEQCNGSDRWQQSLVSAIEAASPLPAPPDPMVFTRIIHLSFRSQPYSPGAPKDAYEPSLPAQRLAQTDASEDENERALAAFGKALRDGSSHNKVISLTLTGNPSADASTTGPTAAINSSAAASSLPTRPPAE